MATVKDIINAVESYAPAMLQETWDNTGLQIGHRDMEVTGVLTAVDVTPERIEEAIEAGANMVLSHHPLLFKGLKSITAENEVQRAVELAIRNGVAVYSSHTALDNAETGVSVVMARKMGAKFLRPLVPQGEGPTGTGAVAELPLAMTPKAFVEKAKEAFGVKVARCTDTELCPREIFRIALCGGAGGEFIEEAVKAGCAAYITGDIRYHDFVDNARRILLVDCGHFETEALTREVLCRIVAEAYPTLKVTESKRETNPVTYI